MPEPTVAIDARLLDGRSSGDAAYWLGLLQGFRTLEGRPRLLLISNAARPNFIPEGLAVEWFQVPGRFGRAWSLIQLPSAARRLGAQLLHVQYSMTPFWRRPAVSTVHDVSFMIGPQWFGHKDVLLLRSGVASAARHCTRVLTVSETSRTEIERFFPASRGKLRVTFNALSPFFRPFDGSKAQASSSVGTLLGQEGPFILTVGTRSPRKNLALAADCAALLAGEIPHKLVIVGARGWGAQPSEHPNVISLQSASPELLGALYRGADLYLAPALHEGFGLPLLEAFASECPVVCSAGGALPEIAGGAACVVQDFDPATWARAVQGLLQDSSKLDAMRRAGLSRLGDFDWKDTAAQTMRAYQEALG